MSERPVRGRERWALHRTANRQAERKCSIVVEGPRAPAKRSDPHHAPGAAIWSGPQGVRHGEESYRLPEIAGAGGGRKSLAADWARARSARPQHHGVLQGVQRPDPEAREGLADPGGHHDLRRSLLHVRDEDAARLL